MSRKSGLRAGAWTAAVLLALASPGSYPSQGGAPNLRPYQPEGWSDAIVVSTRQGDNLRRARTAGFQPSLRCCGTPSMRLLPWSPVPTGSGRTT